MDAVVANTTPGSQLQHHSERDLARPPMELEGGEHDAASLRRELADVTAARDDASEKARKLAKFVVKLQAGSQLAAVQMEEMRKEIEELKGERRVGGRGSRAT